MKPKLHVSFHDRKEFYLVCMSLSLNTTRTVFQCTISPKFTTYNLKFEEKKNKQLATVETA